MDRKKFIRNVTGAMAAVIIGKYLPASLLPVPGAADLPGIGEPAYTIRLKRGWIQESDIILLAGTGAQYYISRKSPNVLLATNIENPIHTFKIQEVDGFTPGQRGHNQPSISKLSAGSSIFAER